MHAISVVETVNSVGCIIVVNGFSYLVGLRKDGSVAAAILMK